MRTEDDLLVAFRDLERLAPDTADVISAVYDHPGRAASARRPPPHTRRQRALRASAALGAAAMAAAAVILAMGHGPATKGTPSAPHALQAHLLAAIDTASNDVLYTRGVPASGGGNWQWPAYPRAHQIVHEHVAGFGWHGVVFKDGEFSFRMPTRGEPAGSYTSNLDQGGLKLKGTLLVVNHFRHVWGVWHGHFILGFTLDAARIRAEIAHSQFKVIGRTELRGRPAIKLKIIVPPNDEAPPHVTTVRLWVDARTYLPMREYQRMSNGQQNVTDYFFLAPTPANLAKLRPKIPAGYTRVGPRHLFGR